MNVCLLGPASLSQMDKEELHANIEALVSGGYTIHLLAYRSIEQEVFKFFLERLEKNPLLANQLKVYSFQSESLLPEKTKIPLEELKEAGVSFESFEQTPSLLNSEYFITRKIYIECYRKIIERCELVISFKNESDAKLMIPIDIAKELNIKSISYQLPGENVELFELDPALRTKTFDTK